MGYKIDKYIEREFYDDCGGKFTMAIQRGTGCDLGSFFRDKVSFIQLM